MVNLDSQLALCTGAGITGEKRHYIGSGDSTPVLTLSRQAL